MLSKHEMDIIKNLAAHHTVPWVEYAELVNVAVERILEEKERVGIANDGILIAIASRAMKDYKISSSSPVFIPKGSFWAVSKQGMPVKVGIVEGDLKDLKQDLDKKYAIQEAMEEARKIVMDDRLFEALLIECKSIKEIINEFNDITFYTVVKLRASIREIFEKFGFSGK